MRIVSSLFSSSRQSVFSSLRLVSSNHRQQRDRDRQNVFTWLGGKTNSSLCVLGCVSPVDLQLKADLGPGIFKSLDGELQTDGQLGKKTWRKREETRENGCKSNVAGGSRSKGDERSLRARNKTHLCIRGDIMFNASSNRQSKPC